MIKWLNRQIIKAKARLIDYSIEEEVVEEEPEVVPYVEPKGPYDIDDTIVYEGRHEPCIGREYIITKEYPPVWGIFYYDMIIPDYKGIWEEDGAYRELSSVPHPSIKKLENE